MVREFAEPLLLGVFRPELQACAIDVRIGFNRSGTAQHVQLNGVREAVAGGGDVARESNSMPLQNFFRTSAPGNAIG
jgi:hypothetical protein